jgi:hypothetical protein
MLHRKTLLAVTRATKIGLRDAPLALRHQRLQRVLVVFIFVIVFVVPVAVIIVRRVADRSLVVVVIVVVARTVPPAGAHIGRGGRERVTAAGDASDHCGGIRSFCPG